MLRVLEILRLLFTPSLSAPSAPLRESILHAEAQRTQRVCTGVKAVRVAQRRDTSSAYAPGLNFSAIPSLRDFGSRC